MPNWVYNDVWIAGPTDEVERFVTTVGEQSICETFLPLPDEAHTVMEIGGTKVGVFTDGGYQTAIDLWGTKWGDCSTEPVDYLPGLAHYRYETAWAPMTTAWLRISEMFPALTFVTAYTEEQPAFCEAIAIAKGDVTVLATLDCEGGPEYDENDEEAYWLARFEYEAGLRDRVNKTAFAYARKI